MKLEFITYPNLLNLNGFWLSKEPVQIIEQIFNDEEKTVKSKKTIAPSYMATRGTKLTLESEELSTLELAVLAGMEMSGTLVRLDTDYDKNIRKFGDFKESLYESIAKNLKAEPYISTLPREVLVDFAPKWEKEKVEVLNPIYREQIQAVVEEFYKILDTENVKNNATKKVVAKEQFMATK